MTAQITDALANGFTSKQIIDYLLRQFPSHSKKIKKALGAGFTAEQVLKFLHGGRKEVNTDSMEENTPLQRTMKKDIANRENVNKRALQGAALGASALAAPMAGAALKRAIPANLLNLVSGQSTNQSPSPTPTAQNLPNILPPAQEEISNISSQTSQPPVTEQSIPQPAQTIQPEVKGINLEPIKQKYKGFINKIDDLVKAGNEPDQIAGYFKSVAPSQTDKLEKETGHTIEDIIAEHLKDQSEEKLPQSVPVEKTEPVIEPKASKIEKKSTVATPNGIGEVREIRGDKALVEVDGKLQKINVEDMQNPQFSEDEIADAYDNLMSKIPEEHRSGFISWAGYDEDKNVLGFIPRGGKYEELENITPEEAKMIKEGKGVARTTGANREGLWIAGEDTRGGIISQIIHDRRKQREVGEKEQLKFDFELPKKEKQDRGMKPQFDEMAYARGLSQERDRKKKLEEKERKKKERDEAKKRKK